MITPLAAPAEGEVLTVAEADAEFAAKVMDEGEEPEHAPGQAVLTKPRQRFGNLATAMKALLGALTAGENKKVEVARIAQSIRDQELYKEVGAADFKAFLPTLVAQAEAAGLGSGTSVKRYLAFADVYLDELHLAEKPAMQSVSHLHKLLVVAERDRTSGELLTEPTKAGKIGAEKFELLARMITVLVSAPSKKQKETGLDEAETVKLLVANKIGEAAEVFAGLMGRVIVLPVGGWSLEDTQEVIDAIRGKDEEASEGEVVKFWMGEFDTANKRVFVTDIEFRQKVEGEVKVIERYEVNKDYSQEMFKTLRGKDKSEIEGLDKKNEA